MKTFLILTGFFYSINLIAQYSDTRLEAIDSLLLEKIQNYREANNIKTLQVCAVLNASSSHHSYYMSQSLIVSHEEKMDLPLFHNLNSPRERINFYVNDAVPNDNNYAEICLGIKLKKSDLEETAEKIFNEILNSDNKILLDSESSHYIGLSVKSRKNRYFATLNLGMEKNSGLSAMINDPL